METQGSNPEQAAAPLTKEAVENLFQVIQALREQKAKKKGVLLDIRDVRNDVRAIRKNKKNARCYLKHLKWNLASIDEDIRLAKEIVTKAGYDPDKIYTIKVVPVTGQAAAPVQEKDADPITDGPVMQCANLTPTVPDDTPPPQAGDLCEQAGVRD